MTSVERILNAINGKEVDRVPVIPEMIQNLIEIAGGKHGKYSTDAEEMAKIVLNGQKFYGYDAVYVSTDNYILAEAFGGKMHFPEDEPPQLLEHPLEDTSLNNLILFSTNNGRIPVILEATRICREKLGNDVFVKTNIDSAPFSAAASLRGPQNIMLDMYDNPSFVKELLELCTDAIIAYGKAAANAGAHGIAFGDSVSSLLNAQAYEEFSLPFAQRAIKELKKTGLPVFYHVCGDTNHIAELLIETEADCIEIDSLMSMKKMKELAQGRCCIEGNIHTIDSILNGTPEQVRQESYELIKLFGRQGGFILSSACEVPRHSPPKNILALTEAAISFPYDNKGV